MQLLNGQRNLSGKTKRQKTNLLVQKLLVVTNYKAATLELDSHEWDLVLPHALQSETVPGLRNGLDAFEFCTLPAVVWLHMLESPDARAHSPWHRSRFSEAQLHRTVVLGVPESKMAMLKRIARGLGGTMICMCSCGEPYLIGNCGLAMIVGKCTSCGLPTGGQHHQSLANQTELGLAKEFEEGNQNDTALLGMPSDMFDQATSHTERDMNPIQYRILVILQLMCIVHMETSMRAIALDVLPPAAALGENSGHTNETVKHHLVHELTV
jgi:hypothetical protein